MRPGPVGPAVRRASWAAVWHLRLQCGLGQAASDLWAAEACLDQTALSRHPGTVNVLGCSLAVSRCCVALSGLCCELTSRVCDHVSIKLSYRWGRARSGGSMCAGPPAVLPGESVGGGVGRGRRTSLRPVALCSLRRTSRRTGCRLSSSTRQPRRLRAPSSKGPSASSPRAQPQLTLPRGEARPCASSRASGGTQTVSLPAQRPPRLPHAGGWGRATPGPRPACPVGSDPQGVRKRCCQPRGPGGSGVAWP